ncbi:MAG: GIY-YIG nuclease family protein [Erythrobacter sp.]
MKLFLVDGTPSGVITAELGVSSVRAVVANRVSLPDLISRQEASRIGVYLLMGSDDGESLKVYVGEGDSVRTRLSSHDSDDNKAFFERIVLIVSKDENLTKAHGRYLESRLIEQIKGSGQAEIANGTSPSFSGLPEAEIADMERVLEEISILLPILGFDVLKAQKPSNLANDVSAGPRLTTDYRPIDAKGQFIARIRDATGEAIEDAGQFILLDGSKVYVTEKSSFTEPLRRRKARLRQNEKLVDTSSPELWELVEDTNFGSPSAASAFIAGRSDNGRTTSRAKDSGKTYAEWREEKLRQNETRPT